MYDQEPNYPKLRLIFEEMITSSVQTNNNAILLPKVSQNPRLITLKQRNEVIQAKGVLSPKTTKAKFTIAEEFEISSSKNM